MRTRLVALFLALLLLPLGLSLWLGYRSVQDGQTAAFSQARSVWTPTLDDLRSRVRDALQAEEERIRTGRDPLVLTWVTLNGDEVASPSRYRADGTEDPFFERTAVLWDGKFWTRPASEGAAAATAGWEVFGTADQPQFLYWYRNNGIKAAEVDGWPLLSLVSAALPDLGWSKAEAALRALELRDAAGRVFQRWGTWDSGDSAPVVSRSLSAPLEGWEFRLMLAPAALGAAGDQLVWITLLAGVGLAGVLALGGWVFLRTWNAQMAEAAQRVRFVNQVSHELKTPLTNLQLYGELLERSLGDAPLAAARAHLEVMRAEGGRLGRLISNVLTFARTGEPEKPRLRRLVWDVAIDKALSPFRVGLADRGLTLDRVADGPIEGDWDPDWVEQIVGNLVSNAEKYAAPGVVTVATGSLPGQVWVRVADQGPGIPTESAERIFDPFFRLDDRLTAASGTGLGLTIARHLARQHGGELFLEPTRSGASFRLELPWGDKT